MNKKVTLPVLEFNMTRPQSDIYFDKERFRVVIAGRRFGKTFLSKYELVSAALAKKNAQVAYIAPTRAQAKQLMWLALKQFIPASYIKKKEEVDLTMTLINGSQIFLRGAENETGLLGLGLDLVVLDEFARMEDTLWPVTVRPTLSDKQGRALFISTPLIANPWVFELWTTCEGKKGWSKHHYTTLEGGNVPLEEIENAKHDMDTRTFKQEYEASFESLSGRVYYTYDPAYNDRDDIQDDGVSTLYIGEDFNYDPGCAVVMLKKGDEIHVIDEIIVHNCSTDIMAQEIKRRYPNRDIVMVPDPTGLAHKTSAMGGATDHSILRGFGFQVYSPGRPYPVSTKINTANRAFCDAAGKRRVFLKKGDTTKGLRRSLMGLCYVPGTSIPDPKSEYSHEADAACYALLLLTPLQEAVRTITVVG